VRWFADRADLAHVIVVPGPRNARHRWLASTVYEIGGPPAPASPGYHVLTGWGRLREILDRERPDVVELGSIYLAPWALRRAMIGRPVATVGFFHSDLSGAVLRVMGRRLPPRLARRTRRTLSAYVRTAYRACRLVVAPSEAARDVMADAGIPNIRVVPFGVDPDVFNPGRRDPMWKSEVGAGPGDAVALYVGRLGPEKGLDAVLDALPRLHATCALRLISIGDGPLRAHVTAFAATHPKLLTVQPFEPDPARLARAYASADLLIAPCTHETFGMAGLEAAACGLPVVSAAAGAVGARVGGASWARTFTAGDRESLVRAVGAILAADRPTLRQEARAAAQPFTWERTFASMVEIYGEAVSR